MSKSFRMRRYLRIKKILERKRVLIYGGYQQGTVYDKHINKLKRSYGYLSKHGTLLHYGYGTNKPSQKVRDRKSRNGTNNWPVKDLRVIDDIDC